MENFEIINIDMNTFTGSIPAGYELVEYEKGADPELDGVTLMGFDEVGSFFKNGSHAFIRFTD